MKQRLNCMVDKIMNSDKFYINSINSRCIYGSVKDDIDISIVVPTFRREQLLCRTLNSVFKQKKVTKLKYQIIVISNDPEFDLTNLDVELPDNLVFYVNEENLGMVGNMNRAILLSKGKYVAFLQDDDILLNDYLITIEQVLKEKKIADFGCIIPNSYVYYSESDSVFGKRAMHKNKVKTCLGSLLDLFNHKKYFQQVNTDDCIKAWFNGFGGGPTCGMLFDRSKLLATVGFNPEYPYVFDMVFMYEYAKLNKVFLLDKFLSVYRMSDSASNKPEVQEDFYRGDCYLLECEKSNPFVIKYSNEIKRFAAESKCKEVIDKHCDDYKKHNIKYYWFRFVRLINLLTSGLYREKVMPSRYMGLL